MPTNRTRIGRQPIRGQVPPGALWWLRHGRSPGLDEAEALGLTEADVWIASNLHYARPTAGWLSRATLRQLGYGAAIDRHVADGRVPADDWRTPPSAEAVPLRRKVNNASQHRRSAK